MAGERLESASLGWHGIEGDRRLAVRRIQDRSGFPWLSASRLADLLRFTPLRAEGVDDGIPTHVRAPDGEIMEVFGDELRSDIERRHGAPVEVMHMRGGVFDDGAVSVIAASTVAEISRVAGMEPDTRRFRPNIVVRLADPTPFAEDGWLGGFLEFGPDDSGPRISVTMRDVRCSMINLDPETARSAPEMLKAAVRANGNNAGVYGTVVRAGRLAVGQTIRFQAR